MAILSLSLGDCQALIDPRRGGSLIQLRHQGLQIDCLRTPDAQADENPFLYGTPPLLPPNRIAGGTFTFDGRAYRLPLNEPGTGCSLHGLLHAQSLSVLSCTARQAALGYQAQAGEYLGFPHAFSLRLLYTMLPDGIEQTLTVTNNSNQTMPFAIGWHTTFHLPFAPGSSAEDVTVSLHAAAAYPRDARTFLPTWQEETSSPLLSALRAGTLAPAAQHVSCLVGQSPDHSILLFDRAKNLGVAYTASDYRYWLLFNAGSKDFLSAEPLSWIVDAPHSPWDAQKSGLIAIPPNARRSFTSRITMFKKI